MSGEKNILSFFKPTCSTSKDVTSVDTEIPLESIALPSQSVTIQDSNSSKRPLPSESTSTAKKCEIDKFDKWRAKKQRKL